MDNWVVYIVEILLFLLIACILWWWNEIWYVIPVKARCKSFSLKLPPGHLGFPFFGEYFTFSWYFQLTRRPHDFITSRILNTNEGIRQYWPTREALGINSILTTNGLRHDIIRSFFVHEFTRRDALSHIVSQVQPTIVAALQSWSLIGQINTFDRLKKATFGYMSRFVVGTNSVIEVDHEKLFSRMNRCSRSQPWSFPGTPYYRSVQCRKKIMRMLNKEMQKRKEEMNRGSESDIMDKMMKIRDNEGKFLRDEEVLDNVISGIDISYVAIAYAVMWSMYFLAKNPDVLLKLREENMEMAQKNNSTYLTYEDITTLKYTNKVVEETLRIANIVVFTFKRVTNDIEFEGYMIPKDWMIMLWLRHLHTDPSNFENPIVGSAVVAAFFDLLQKCCYLLPTSSRPKHGTFLPFGGGSRSCPGNLLARVNVALFLHHLSVGYKWELLNPDVPITYLSHPKPADGLEITFSKI